jgi:CHAT domain-containing protein
VVGTLWPVADETTPELMADFHARLLAPGGAGRLASLLAAKRALRRAHPDPFHWAGLVLLGDPR